MRATRGRDGSTFQLLSAIYSDEPMLDIWSAENMVSLWLRVEAELAQVEAEVGLGTQADAAAIDEVCDISRIDLDDLWRESEIVGYPILPLVRQITRVLPEGPNGKVHLGATTQDIMDTALAMQMGEACDRLEQLTIAFGDALAMLVENHMGTVMAARTHAQQAVPTTFGAKMATFLAEISRSLENLRGVRNQVCYVSLFGAGGTSAAYGPHASLLRRRLGEQLGLAVDDVPWHVSRDRIARYGQAVALLSSCTVRFAREIIDLSRTEIGEVREQGGYHRGASSTMPHKTNPIFSESVVGFGVTASTLSGLLFRAMEAGHERSAGEWQIEWLTLPQISAYSATAMALAADVAQQLEVFPERMLSNMTMDEGLLMSESAMMELAAIIGRESAHDLVYRVAGKSRLVSEPFWPSLMRELSPDVVARMGHEVMKPEEYVGEALVAAKSSLQQWRLTKLPNQLNESLTNHSNDEESKV